MKAAAGRILVNSQMRNQVKAEICRRSFYKFVREFWPEISASEFVPNWHISLFCDELTCLAERVAQNLPKEHDLIVNVPPGTTKTVIFSIMFPVWCWINWYWFRFITASYSSSLSLESAEYSRDMVRSQKFVSLFPDITIKTDKDMKSNFRVQWIDGRGITHLGGNRYSTSVGGTLTGFHGHILIVDDPLDPLRAASTVELKTASDWMDRTLSTRKIDKSVTPTVLIMQRLAQDDPSGHWLAKGKENLRHLCLPGEIKNYADEVNPPELKKHYVDGLLDPIRMSWTVLKEMNTDLGKYGYAGQVGQRPTPPGGGMFRVDAIRLLQEKPPKANYLQTIRYWDKAGSTDAGAYTVGIKMSRLIDDKYLIEDVVRGQWSAGLRENVIKETAIKDGNKIIQWTEQEPGSGGKESAENTIRNLRAAGISCKAERPTGDKIYRADPFAQAVEDGNVIMLEAPWNDAYIQELSHAPLGKYKDQWDASAGAYNKVRPLRKVGKW